MFKKCGQAVQRLFQMAVQSSSSAVSLLSTVIAQSTRLDYESEMVVYRHVYRPVIKANKGEKRTG